MKFRDRLRVALCMAGLFLPAVAWSQVAFEQGNFYRIPELQIPDCAECKGQVNLRIENLETKDAEVTFEVWIASSPVSGFSAISYSLVFPPEFAEVRCSHGLNTKFSSDYDSTITYTRFSASAVSGLDLPGFSVHVLHRGAFETDDPSTPPSTLTLTSRQLSQFNCPLRAGSASPQIALYPYPNYSQSFYSSSRQSLADSTEVAVRYAQRAMGPGGNLEIEQGESSIQLHESHIQGVPLDEQIFVTASEAGERVRNISLNINYFQRSGQLYWRALGDESFKLFPERSTRIAGEMGTNEATVFLRGLRIATGDSFSPAQATISLELESTLGSQDDSSLSYEVFVTRDRPVRLSTPSKLLTAAMFQFFRNKRLLKSTPSENEVIEAVARFCSRDVLTGAEGFYADSDGDAVPNNIEVRSGTDCRDSGSNDLVGGISVRPTIELGAEEKIMTSAFASQPSGSEQLGVSCTDCVQLTAYVKETDGPCNGVTLPGNFEQVCQPVFEENKSSFQPGLSTIFWLGVDQYGNWASSGPSLPEQSVYLAPQINFGEDIVLSSNASENGTLTTFLDISGADTLSLKKRSTDYLSPTKQVTILEDGVERKLDGLRLPLTQKLAFQFTYENLVPGMRKVLQLQCDDQEQYAPPGEKRFIAKNATDRFFATCGKDALYVTRGTQILPPQVRFAVYERNDSENASEVLVFKSGTDFPFKVQATGYGDEISPRICSVATVYTPPGEPLPEPTACSIEDNPFEGMTAPLPPDSDYVPGNVLRIVAEVEGRWSGNDSLTRNRWGISVPVLETTPLDSIPETLDLIATNGNAFADITVLPGSLLLRSTDRSSEATELARSGVLSSPYVDASIGRPPYASSPVSEASVFDFRIKMLSPALETPNFARIRLHLAIPVPTGGGSVARYSFARSEWEYFRTGSGGSYYSAPDPCPAVVADSPVPEPWQSGLNMGHRCLLLHIVDDGVNDADATPGSIAALVSMVPPGDNNEISGSGSGSGSDLGQWLIAIAGFLVFAGSYDPLTLLGLLLVILLSVFQKRLGTRKSVPK